MSRRSKLEIYLDVLGTIKRGTEKPTSIMYESNLSWKPLRRILAHMISQDLISEVDMTGVRGRDKRTSKCYKLTQKGENVIRYFMGARELLPLEEIILLR